MMTLIEAIQARHSVRSYLDKPLPQEVLQSLQDEITLCNRQGNLHIQLVTGEANAFQGMLAHYGSFKNVQNYIVLVGDNSPDFTEKTGYYGERLVLKAQQLGLNTCWVALTYSKAAARKNITVESGEKMGIVIALGYGETQGKTGRRCKTFDKVTKNAQYAPEWFCAGVQAALLAPTAMNQQKFTFIYENGKVTAKAGLGPHAKIDLGIVKYHFEVASGYHFQD